jgi:hypothetical protein
MLKSLSKIGYSLILLSALFISNISFGQITLPRQFKCMTQDSWRDNFFSYGTYNFRTEAHGYGIESAKDLVPYLEEAYQHKLVFKKTKDGLAWGTGKYQGKYFYIVVVPESLASISLFSAASGTQFSNYSSWLLQQVRNNISSGKDFYLTDVSGKECSSN